MAYYSQAILRKYRSRGMMTKFIFTGDIIRPGRVVVEAETLEDAITLVYQNKFKVYDEDHHDFLTAFNWNEDDDSVEVER